MHPVYRISLVLPLLWLAVACGKRAFVNSKAAAMHHKEIWQLNSLEQIGGVKPTIIGAPQLRKGENGERYIAFNGKTDGLLINRNPIAGATSFAVEVEFKPDDAYPENSEQRFLHIQDPDNPNRRILIELRLNDRKQWYADFYMRTDSASLVLIDSTKTHPLNEWATITLTYKDGRMQGWVNGVKESSGEIQYLPISPSAKTSLGTRMDQRSWFKGAIRTVRFATDK